MNTLFIVFLAIAAVSGKNLCSPGSLFRMDCNVCSCSQDGKAMACTDMACSGQNKNLNNMEAVQTGLAGNLCTSGSFFRMDCNVCTCSKDGKAMACTDKACLLALEARQTVENLCTPKSFFRMDCNMCTCSKDGKAMACTDKSCPNNLDVLQTEMICKPGSTFKPDNCNTCKCNKDVKRAACTMIMCSEKLSKQTEESKQVCIPRSQFKNSCNTCACADDGLSFACTRMLCEESIKNEDGLLKVAKRSVKQQVCQAGSMYRPDNCNICVCNEDGTDFACSLKICLPTLHPGYGHEEQPKWSTIYKQGDVCTRGRYFYSECNTCVCTDSGTRAYCTMENCKKDE